MSQQEVPKTLKVLELFEEGKRFTEDLLKENERLRMMVASLKNERVDMENSFIKVDVARLKEKNALLEGELKELREENEDLKRQFLTAEEENREFADRYVQVERQNSDLVSMYVASYRLHSTLDYEEVLRIVQEIVINMVGSEVFGIYVLDPREQQLVMVAQEGLEGRVGETVPIGTGRIGQVAQSGEIFADMEAGIGAADSTEPIAVIPLKAEDKVVGVIAIFKLLVQKDGFVNLDFELFELLGAHAATALYGARMFSDVERKRSTLQGFIDLLKTDVGAAGEGQSQ